MQTLKFAIAICDELDQICRKFIWGSNDGDKAIHKIDWAIITRLIDCGGLGVRPMHMMSTTAISTLSWCFMNNPSKLWVRVLRVMYSENRRGFGAFIVDGLLLILGEKWWPMLLSFRKVSILQLKMVSPLLFGMIFG